MSNDSTLMTLERSAQWITVNHPNAFSGLNPEVIGSLNPNCDEVENEGSIRALLISRSHGGATNKFSNALRLIFLAKCDADFDASSLGWRPN